LNAKPLAGRPIAIDWAVPRDQYLKHQVKQEIKTVEDKEFRELIGKEDDDDDENENESDNDEEQEDEKEGEEQEEDAAADEDEDKEQQKSTAPKRGMWHNTHVAALKQCTHRLTYKRNAMQCRVGCLQRNNVVFAEPIV
jgi:cobalamin biosynthesis protein CobT